MYVIGDSPLPIAFIPNVDLPDVPVYHVYRIEVKPGASFTIHFEDIPGIVTPPPVYGCMEEGACNYDSNANTPSECTYPEEANCAICGDAYAGTGAFNDPQIGAMLAAPAIGPLVNPDTDSLDQIPVNVISYLSISASILTNRTTKCNLSCTIRG